MNTSSFVKKITIKYDPIKGTINYENDDEMTYAEALGAIEYVKMMITTRYINEENDQWR